MRCNTECWFENGEMNGLYTEYYDNGNVVTTGLMKNNQKEGLWFYYFYDGATEGEIWYNNGLKNGRYTRYYEDSTLLETGWYNQGREDSSWTFRIRYPGSRGFTYDTINGEFKDKILKFNNVSDPYERGKEDAQRLISRSRIFYYGLSATASNIIGVVVIGIVCIFPPQINHLNHPVCRMFDNTEYLRGYRKKAHKMKALNLTAGFVTGVAGVATTIALFVSQISD